MPLSRRAFLATLGTAVAAPFVPTSPVVWKTKLWTVPARTLEEMYPLKFYGQSVYFVSAYAGLSTTKPDGRTPKSAFASLDTAFARARANDRILIAP